MKAIYIFLFFMLINIGWTQESNYLLFTKHDKNRVYAIGPGSEIRIRGIFLNGMDMDIKGTVDRVTRDTIIFKNKKTAPKHEKLAIPLVNIHSIILNPNTSALYKIGTFLIVVLLTILISVLLFWLDRVFDFTTGIGGALGLPFLALLLALLVVLPIRKKQQNRNRINDLPNKWKVELVVRP